MGFERAVERPTRADLEVLIARGRQDAADPAFCARLAEVAADVLVRQADPTGSVSKADAVWLVAKLSNGGGLSCPAQFQMLKRVFADALSVPPLLTAFAIREIELAILTGRREILGGVDFEPAVVTAGDVEALRALAFAPTREPSLPIDTGTVEALFDIAHATGSARNDPAFADLFALLIANHLKVCDNAGWILAHLSRGGPLTPAEARLLTLLKVEAASGRAELRLSLIHI